MEVKLGKWQKNGLQRIYFNAPALGSCKVYAYEGKNGIFDLGRYQTIPGYDSAIEKAENAGVEEIEKIMGKPIGFETKFADVWAAL